MKYIEYARELFSKPSFPVFTIGDARLALKSEGIRDDYLRLLLHKLYSDGEITRVTRGTYTFHDDSAVVGFAFKPFYYGLENALSLHGISDQGTNFIVMTSRNVRTGIRTFKGRNYRVKRVMPEQIFGYVLMHHNGFWIPVSDVEKTVIDMLYFKDTIRDELWQGIVRGLDIKRFKGYLGSYDPAFRARAMGFLAVMRGSGMQKRAGRHPLAERPI